jgi:hypothetical protein
MKTFKQLWLERGKAIVNGKVWDVWDANPGRTEIILLRRVRVKSHVGLGGMKGGGWRTITIRRSIDAPATEAIPSHEPKGRPLIEVLAD